MAVAKPRPARRSPASKQQPAAPRTAADRARSRAAAIEHGLAGVGVALPGEDGVLIEADHRRAQEEFAPTTLAGRKLVRDIAMIWTRQDRARRFEAAVLSRRARRAGEDFDRARRDHADRLIEAIEANPRAYRRALLEMPEGVDRLVDGLTMLLGEIAAPAPTWGEAHHKRLDALLGFRPDDLPWSRPTRFSRAALGDFGSVAETEVAAVPHGERQDWAMGEVVGVIEAEIARLIAHRATLDLDRIAADRADAEAQAHLDPGPDGALAHRYLTDAARDLSRALRDLHHVESRHGTAPAADEVDAAGVMPEAAIDGIAAPDLPPEIGPDQPPPTDPEPTTASDHKPEVGPGPLPRRADTSPIGPSGVASPAAGSPVRSFGSATPAAPIRPAASPALRPIHASEPPLFIPQVRR